MGKKRRRIQIETLTIEPIVADLFEGAILCSCNLEPIPVFAGEYRCPSCNLLIYGIEIEVEMLEFMNRNKEGVWRYEYEGEEHEIGVERLVVGILMDENVADANEVLREAFMLVLNSDRTVDVGLVME